MNAPETVNPLAVFNQERERMLEQLRRALPAHIPAERYDRALLTAVQQNPELLRVERRSLWNAAMRCAADGLLPDGREAALIVFADKRRGPIAQYLPMIAGIRKKVRNSGEIATWDCHVVHANDKFDFTLGDDPSIQHRPALDNPGPVIAAYSVATLRTGERSREIMSRAEIEKVRERSRAANAGPWVTDFEEMCRKTVARRHSKVLPMSTDLDDLLRRDDELYDMEGAREEAAAKRRSGQRPNVSAVLDAFVQPREERHESPFEEPLDGPEPGELIDQETGEIARDRAFENAQPIDPPQQPQKRRGRPPKARAIEQQPAAPTGSQREPEQPREPESESPEPLPPPMRTMDPEIYIERAEAIVDAAEDADQLEAWWSSTAQRQFRATCGLTVDDANKLRQKVVAKATELRAPQEHRP